MNRRSRGQVVLQLLTHAKPNGEFSIASVSKF